jgi:hypothetical protein
MADTKITFRNNGPHDRAAFASSCQAAEPPAPQAHE